NLSRHQLNDSVLKIIWDNKKNGNPILDPKIKRVCSQYYIHMNVLVHRFPHRSGVQLAIPSECVTPLIDYHHQLPTNPLDAITHTLLPPTPSKSKEEIHRQVRRNLRRHAELRKRQQKGATTQFEVGDWVLLRNKVTSESGTKTFAKFMPLYSGPFEVVAKPHPNTYRLCQPTSRKERGVYNINNLKFYHRRSDGEEV
ncbi:hypothetical protein BDFB_010150, partial [Asbolus verrucosus]